jgi:hypothetical protein
VEDDNILGFLGLMVEDVQQVYELYGNPSAYVHGKTRKKKVSRWTTL